MKRVLMIIPFFPPMAGGGVYRPLSFVRYLRDHGWQPTVIAPRGDAFWIRDETLTALIPGDVRVVRTETWSGQAILGRRGARAQKRSSRGFGGLRRAAAALLLPDSYLGWYPFAVRAAMREATSGDYDALYSTSPPETAHLVGRAVQRRTRLPWVADFRDPWMNLRLLDPPTPLHAAIHRRMERSVCRRARVVVTTRWNGEVLSRAYPDARIARIPNGYDGGEVASVASITPGAGPMRIVHAGMLTQNRSAAPFLEALHAFMGRRPEARGALRVDFVGAREDANELALERLGLGDIARFRDGVAHADALREERAAHVLLLIKHVDPRYDGLVPGKLYEYIGLRRPILALAPAGEARDVVTSLHRGETADPGDVAGIARAIETLYDRFRAGTLDSSYDLSERDELERSRLAGEMARVLDAETEARSR